MLVLSRKQGQSIVVGHDTQIYVCKSGSTVRLGVKTSSNHTAINRGEVWEKICSESNQDKLLVYEGEEIPALIGCLAFCSKSLKSNQNLFDCSFIDRSVMSENYGLTNEAWRSFKRSNLVLPCSSFKTLESSLVNTYSLPRKVLTAPMRTAG